MNSRCKVTLETAAENDAEQIRDLMVIVETDEASKWYNNGERPYIPGYDSVEMQVYHMRNGKYYKIHYEGALAGVILISTTGREHARIDRLYIHPAYQGKGVGSEVIHTIEGMYPEVMIWTLDTIQKSPRNHHFYEKLGYELAGEDEEERYYRKTIDKSVYEPSGYLYGKNLSHYNFRDCCMEDSDFYDVNMQRSNFTNMNMSEIQIQNVNLWNSRITNSNMSQSVWGDSNLSGVEICHVSMENAYLHNANLQNLVIQNCNIDGMKIDGILVSDLLEAYREKHSC